MHRIAATIGLLAALAFFSAVIYAEDKNKDVLRGKIIYEAHCVACHGEGGKGDGLSAHALIPKPPDFTDPAYKATATKEKLTEVITDGKQGTQMEGWKDKLSAEDIYAVMEYIRSLR